MGLNDEFSGRSSIACSRIDNRLTVASPASSATIMSPFSATGLLTDDHQIAIVDAGVAHAFAGDAERETAPVGGQATFNHHFAQNVLFRQDRMSGGYATQQRNRNQIGGGVVFFKRTGQSQTASLSCLAREEPFLHQLAHLLMGGRRRYSKPIGEFVGGRSETVLDHEIAHLLQHAPLRVGRLQSWFSSAFFGSVGHRITGLTGAGFLVFIPEELQGIWKNIQSQPC